MGACRPDGFVMLYWLCLGVVLLGKSAEHLANLLLRNFVTDPAVGSLMSGCCASIDPAEVGEESFGFGLTVTRLLPHADGIFSVPLREPLGGECFFDNTERDLNPSDNLGGVERTGKTSELNRSFSSGHQVVDVKKFVPATGRLEPFSVPIFLDAPAVGTLLPPLGASDGIHSFFKVRGGVDKFGQFRRRLPLESDMNMNSARRIHGMPLLIQDTDNFDELDDPGFASEYRRDNFDSNVSDFVGADTSIALGNPTFRQVGNLLAG